VIGIFNCVCNCFCSRSKPNTTEDKLLTVDVEAAQSRSASSPSGYMRVNVNAYENDADICVDGDNTAGK